MAAAVEPAVAADFTLSDNKILTIAAGDTTSTGAVTITAVNNTSDDPNKQVTVSAGASNSQGVNAPAEQDADHRRRRGGADGDADSDTGLDRRGRRFKHGDGDAQPCFERKNHHHGSRRRRAPTRLPEILR